MRLLRRFLCLAAVIVASSQAARAVVISYGDGQGNTRAAAENPYWGNVARMSGASVVYLGNRWAITANHVSDADVRFSDGRVFKIGVGADVTLKNSLTSAIPDLRLVRLAEDPGLPAVPLVDATPGAATRVMMVGAGLDRGRQEIGWALRRTASGTAMTQVPLPAATMLGFNQQSSAAMRWGYNLVDSGGLTFTNQNTFAFSTTFDLLGLPFEAQAAVGDSGGGVFALADGSFKLAGIMITLQGLPGQLAGTVAFGDKTFSADVATYSDQIQAVLNRPEPLWQNQANHFDVNRSGTVDPVDALLVINALRNNRTISGAPGPNDPRLDVSGDNALSASDAAGVINYIRIGRPGGAPGSGGTNLVPEPGSVVLAVVGAAMLLAGRFLIRRR